jgi:hypothetical protein
MIKIKGSVVLGNTGISSKLIKIANEAFDD